VPFLLGTKGMTEPVHKLFMFMEHNNKNASFSIMQSVEVHVIMPSVVAPFFDEKRIKESFIFVQALHN